MFCLVVTLRVKAELLDEFLPAQLDMAKKVLSEPGCFRYDVFQDNEDPTLFTRLEIFRDEAAFTDHGALQHTFDFSALGKEKDWWAEKLSFVKTTNLYPSDEVLMG